MTFKFRWLCELLDELDHLRPQRRATNSRHHDPVERIVIAWFKQHVHHISRTGQSAIVLLSALFPERRADRSYGLQHKRLAQIFGRALGISAGRHSTLKTWQSSQNEDFATCVEYVMGQAENPKPLAIHEVTLEEIDLALDEIASNTPGSAPAMRNEYSGREAFEILAPIIRRLQSYEAKWLVRMIMKNYRPAEMPEYVTLHAFHFLLPRLLLVQNNFDAAMTTLSKPSIRHMPYDPRMQDELHLLPHAMAEIQPRLGTMITRQPYDKARSLKHCCEMAHCRVMSIERKYDGEYCQIHIDLSKGRDCITIFSKSGRDSTLDRTVLHDAIRTGLRLGEDDCLVRSHCIVEGELVVWSRRQKQVLPFYHVRKHVLHGGRRIGNQLDSPKRADENVMIVFYDVLMLDQKILINESHKQRRAHLKAIIKQVEGSSHLVERTQIDFSARRALQTLRKGFAEAIAHRWEGFVLKGVDDGYFAWNQSKRGIKLKKDYINGLGDSVDICIVAGRRDGQAALALRLGQLKWTHFYIACLLNKTDVRRYGAKPCFRIIDCLGPASIPKEDILALNAHGQLCCKPFELDLPQLLLEHHRIELAQPHHAFTQPMVVEVMGAGFERAQNTDYWVLRFPRKIGAHTKLHQDRDVGETISFDELQRMAERCMRECSDIDSREDFVWIQKLLNADPRSKYKNQLSPSTCTTSGKTPRTVTTASISPLNGRSRNPKSTALTISSDSPHIRSDGQVELHQSIVHEVSGYKTDNLTRKRRLSTACTDLPLSDCKRVKHSSLPMTNPARKRLVFAENANSMTVKPSTSTIRQQETASNAGEGKFDLKQRAILHKTDGTVMNKHVDGELFHTETAQQHETFTSLIGHLGEVYLSATPNPYQDSPSPLQRSNNPSPSTASQQTTNINAKAVSNPRPPPTNITSQTNPNALPTTAPRLQHPPLSQSTIPETQNTSPPTHIALIKPLHLYITPSSLTQHTLQTLQQHIAQQTPSTFTSSLHTFAHLIMQTNSTSIALIPSHTRDAAQNAARDLQHLVTELCRDSARHRARDDTKVLRVPVFEVAVLEERNVERLLDALQGREDVQGVKPWFCAVLEVRKHRLGGVSATARYEDEDLRRALKGEN